MQTESSHIEILFAKYLQNTISRQEFSEFWELLQQSDLQSLSSQLQTLWLKTEGIAPVYTDEEWNHKLKALIQKAEEEDARKEGRNGGAKNATIIPMRSRWIKWIAAASVIVIASLVTVISKRSEKSPQQTEVAKTNDVPAPSNTRAVITLADGSKVYLDSANNGTIATDNNVNVLKNENGEIVYSPDHQITKSPDHSIAYNTMFNPRGSKVISLTLSDGTKVWLNSESSLKYPIAFAGNTREVEITGEAYFEVQHNAKQPFKVHLPNGSIIEDIGTSFNVNAYADESDIKTTLIEGSVQIFESSANTSASSAFKLKPGEQSIINLSSPNHQITRSPDIDEVLAWKNGRFEFGGQTVDAVMRQIARWYDVDVVYEGQKPLANFRGSVSRQENVGEVLKMLELTKAVKFRIEGKKIIVTR